MQVDRIRGNSQLFLDGFSHEVVCRSRSSDMFATIPTSSSDSSFSSSFCDSPRKVNCIEHRVSKMDTLPGVAIKYGVEVEDIKRLNGLMTDIQMFAHKSLQIPLPGRHPPSNSPSNGSVDNGKCSRDRTSPRRPSNDVLDLLHSLRSKTPGHKVSPAMTRLQSYYGLSQQKGPVLETEMSVYSGSSSSLDDGSWSTEPPFSDPLSRQYLKPRSSTNGFSPFNMDTAMEKLISDVSENSEQDKSIRRRQKNDSNPSSCTNTPEFLKEDNGSGLSGKKTKGLATRPMLGHQTDADLAPQYVIPNGDSFVNVDGAAAVRKLSSSTSLQEPESSRSFVWPTSKWTLNPEVLTRPLFDGLPLPRPISVWKTKAAVD